MIKLPQLPQATLEDHDYEVWGQNVKSDFFIEGQMRAYGRASALAERERCINIIETYRIPVGNSAAGELACEWTYDALRIIRDEILADDE